MIWEKYYRNDRLPGQVRRGSFWWRDNLKNLDQFKELAVLQMQCGDTVFFWQDKWNGYELKSEMPELFSFAKNKFISGKKVLGQEDQTQLFHLPVSEAAHSQMEQLMQRLENPSTIR